MAPTNTHSWTTFYARNRDDEGAIQTLFDAELQDLVDSTVAHFEAPGKLSNTIAGSGNANMLMVPGDQGVMNILHHGFVSNTSEGLALIFVQGNLGDCAYFKILPRDEATTQVKVVHGRRVTITNCPTLASMVGAESADAFVALEAAGNVILRQKPNHVMIHPAVFFLANGAATIRSKDLAFSIIESVRLDPEEEDEEEIERKENEAKALELILATLWASENGFLTKVNLRDIIENPILNHLIRTVKDKLREGPEPTDPGVGDVGAAAAWALSSQSIVQELNRMHESREAAKTLKESNMSLLKALGPAQKNLFTTLSTTDTTVTPAMSDFMTTLTMTKTPQKAVGQLKTETRDWPGTFSEGCCHRLLSTGLLSEEANRANPGGFTLFMFHPKTVEMGSKGFDKNTARLREYFDMEVTDETIEFYAKQGFFHPKNPHDMRIQLQTAHDMLELLTCKGTIAAAGLAYVLDPNRWDRVVTILHDRFQTEEQFGSKFVYSMDRTLQVFLDRVSRSTDIARDVDAGYLLRAATELMDHVERGITIAINLPVALSPKGSTRATGDGSIGSPSKKARTTATPPKDTPKPAGRAYHHPSDEHVNDDTHAEWLVPAGVDFQSLFPDRAPGAKRWPKFTDHRLPKKNKQPRAAPLCVRFQMAARCRYGCMLAHVGASLMTMPEFKQTDRLMKEALKSEPPKA